MSCSYIIKTPNGKEVVTFPTSFGYITEENKTVFNKIKLLSNFTPDQLEKYQSIPLDKVSEEFPDIDNTVNQVVQSISKLTPLSDEDIKNTIKSNLSGKFLDDVNSKIEKLGNIHDIESAIREWSRKSGKSVSDIFTKLDKPITPDYFVGVDTIGVIGKTSIKDEINRLDDKIADDQQSGLDTSLSVAVSDFVKVLPKIMDFDTKRLLPINNTINQNNTLNKDNFTFYQEKNDLSLFLGLFKNIATNIDPKVVLDELTAFNKKKGDFKFNLDNFDINKFFNGSFDEKGNFKEGEFHELFNHSDAGKNVVNSIINAVSNHIIDTTYNDKSTGFKINKQGEIFQNIQFLFQNLNKDTYGKSFFQRQELERLGYDSELRFESSLKRKVLEHNFIKYADPSLSIQHFYPAEEIKSNSYSEVINKIEIGKDLVLFPISKTFNAYGLVTKISGKNNGIWIEGIYKNNLGVIQEINHLFPLIKDINLAKDEQNKKIISDLNTTNKLEYRKFASVEPIIQSKYIPGKLLEGVRVFSNKDGNGFTKEIIGNLISVGSEVNYKLNGSNYLVTDVYPGGLRVINNGKYSIISDYSKLLSFTSEKVKSEFYNVNIDSDDFKGLVKVQENAGGLLSQDDLFGERIGNKTYVRRVLYADENNVYTNVASKAGESIIKSVPRNIIKEAWLSVKKDYTIEDLNKIGTLYDNLTNNKFSSLTHSTFTDKELARTGDYVVFNNGGKQYFGVLLDQLTGKVVATGGGNRYLNIPDKNSIIAYFTDRNIHSDYWLSIDRINKWKINTSTESTLENKQFPLVYLVNNDLIIGKVDESKLVILPNNYLTIGSYVEKSYYDSHKSDYKDKLDITQNVINIINKRDGSNIKSLYVTKEDPFNYIHRNLEGLYSVYNFSKLSSFDKANSKILSPAVYFSIYKSETGMDTKIYRIMRVEGDNVIAHYNSIGPNKNVITVERTFKANELLGNASSVGSIAKLYMLYDNHKISKIVETIKDITKESANTQVYQARLVKELSSRFSNVFKNIDAEIVPESGNFFKGQHAKIQDGKILINKTNSSPADVVHEYLHVLLSALKYTHEDAYNYLMDNNDLKTFDVNDREEEFVKAVSNSYVNNSNFKLKTESEFIAGIKSAISSLNEDSKDKYLLDQALSKISDNNPFEILSTPLVKILGLEKTLGNDHPLYNNGLVVLEPEMRSWMKENNINLKCN